jgi:hypothetical protein
MKSRWALAVAVAMTATVVLSAANAQAIMPFLEVFKATYGDNAEIKKAAEEQKCNICHMGAMKKNKNAYGNALHDLGAEKSMGKAFGENKEEATKKFVEILKKAEEKKNAAGKSFGELLKEGKLPGA